MQFIHYIGGTSKAGKLISIGIGLSSDPAAALEALKGTMPFDLRMLAVELGTSERLESVKAAFKAACQNGFWYQPTAELEAHVNGIESVDPDLGKTTRVSLDLVPEEFAALAKLTQEMGVRSKAELLRRALRFYGAMYRYKAQGFGIQAVKGGKLIQFPELDTAR